MVDLHTTVSFQAGSQRIMDIRMLLERYLNKSPIETAFSWSVKHVLVPEPPSPPSLIEAIHQLFSSSPRDRWPNYIKQYFAYTMKLTNPHRVSMLLEIMRELVAKGILPSKLVCESVLQHLNINNVLTWREGLKMAKQIVGGVDYKGCRDLMKCLLDQYDRLPRTIPDEQLSALQQGKELLSYMLDRNAALLPAYIAHDEIQLRYTQKDVSPHWALRSIIAALQGSMETVANMVSGQMLLHHAPVIGVSNVSGFGWKLDPNTHCFPLVGRLPYNKCLLQPHLKLINHLVAQPNSKDMICSVLGLNKQPHPSQIVESSLTSLVIDVMTITEQQLTMNEKDDEERRERKRRVLLMWTNLTNQFVSLDYLNLFDYTRVLSLIKEKLSCSQYPKARGYLIWLILYHISANMSPKDQQLNQDTVTTVVNLMTAVYQDNEPVPVPDPFESVGVFEMSPACVWTLLTKWSQAQGTTLPSPPNVFSKQIEFLQQQLDKLTMQPPSLISNPFILATLLNAYCTSDGSAAILLALLDFCLKMSKEGGGDGGEEGKESSQSGDPTPIPLECVNTLVLQAKLKLSDKINLQLIKLADHTKQSQVGSSPLVIPALLETISRILLWTGTKNFQSHVIPNVFRLQVWSMLQSMLEVVSFRVHTQISTHLRFQFVQLLNSVAGVSIIPAQLFICAENTALKIIMGLPSVELPLQIANLPDPKQLFHHDSDELNKALLLVFAQSLHITKVDLGVWLENILKELQAVHPTSLFMWPESSVAFFPASIRQYCRSSSTIEIPSVFISRVDQEHQKIQSKTESELQEMYSEGGSEIRLLFCVAWKQLQDRNKITPLLARLLQKLRLSPKKLASLLRHLVDCVVFTCPQPCSPSNPQFMNVVANLNNLVWKYFLCSFDQLILCMVMRSYSGREALTCLSLVHHLLLSSEIISRVTEFTKTVPTDVWKEDNWAEKHSAYLTSHTECFQLDTTGSATQSTPAMPMYLSNICLRMLPVLDLFVQHMLETPDHTQTQLIELLDRYSPLYQYHEYPLRFLYTTLHYYETALTNCPLLRKKFIFAVLGEARLTNLSQEFQTYLAGSDDRELQATDQYYSSLITTVHKGLCQLSTTTPVCSWPLSECFSGAMSVIYTCCVELMGGPQTIKSVIAAVIAALVSRAAKASKEEEDDVLSTVNAIGVLLSALPHSSAVLLEEISSLLKTPPFATPTLTSSPSYLMYNTREGCLLNLAHSFWQHSSVHELMLLTSWMQSSVKPVVTNEVQLLYLCHLFGPIIGRLKNDRPTSLLEVFSEVYQCIQKVDKHQEGKLSNSEPLCDLLYHLKYRHLGADLLKDEVERAVTSLHNPMRMRLRFLVYSLSTPTVESRQLGVVAPPSTQHL